MNTQELLFRLLRIAVCGEAPDDTVKAACTPEMLEAVYTVAARHDLAHLVGQAVSKLSLPESEMLTSCKNAAMQAFMRYLQRDHAYLQTCQVLETAGIPYIPLKGTVLREYYPEPWMRTSCDVDILVREEQLEAAVEVLTRELGYTAGERSDHDVALRSANGFYLELHYDTIQERYEVNGCREVLARIWEDAKPRTPDSCHLWLSDEMFYFYHMAHMAKHFAAGGCGIRAFLDIWILDNKMPHDPKFRDALLAEGGLLQFAQAARKLSRVWFAGEQPEEMDMAMSEFMLRGTLYGDKENRAALGQAKMGGRGKYLLQRAFMPYAYLKDEYPVLKDKKWLTPVYQVVRWTRMLKDGRLGHTVAELKANTGATDTDTAARLLKHLGL